MGIKNLMPRPTLRLFAIALAAALVIGLLLYQRCGLKGCPNIDQLAAYQPGGASVLYDDAGKKFGRLTPIQHAVVKLETLPKHLPQAFVAVEDKRFYDHNGVDLRRVAGALLANIKARDFVQGFSTITMQIGGSIWRDRVQRSRKTIGRKVVEVRLAREIERKYTKDEILELYLNNIYFGGGAYGVEAAARNYFGKSARDLTVAQSALLAALPKSPTIYDPRRSGERARQRRDLVISIMAQQGKLTANQAERAKKERLYVRRDPSRHRDETPVAPYFADAVRRVLEAKYGEDLYTRPLKIYTTLNLRAQRTAEEELRRQLQAIENGVYGRYSGKRYSSKAPPADETDYVQGAVVVMDARSGAVRAHVGGRDWRQSSFDRATRAQRQAGSAFKPFVYAAALAERYAPSQHIKDTPLKMDLPGGEVWEPRNTTGDFLGEVTLRDALVHSRNVPTIRLAADVGLHDVARVARQSGIRSSIPDLPSMAIGSGGVTPIEMARAYSTFATLGNSSQPRWIDRIEDEETGKVLWRPDVKRNEVLDDGVAFLLTDMLREAVSRGTGTAVRRAGFTGPAAGKTGTTNDGTDVWFVGYTPQLVAAVWIGFDNPREIVRNASGGRIAAPVWGRIMRRIYASAPAPVVWSRPESVVEKLVDPATGLVLPEGCKPLSGTPKTELFLRYAEPASNCPQGKPVDTQNFLDKALALARSVWHDTGEWIASHFGREKERTEPERKRYLGVPRLPEAKKASPPVIEPETVDVHIDTTLAPVPITVPVDTLPVDTMTVDSIMRDSLIE